LIDAVLALSHDWIWTDDLIDSLHRNTTVPRDTLEALVTSLRRIGLFYEDARPHLTAESPFDTIVDAAQQHRDMETPIASFLNLLTLAESSFANGDIPTPLFEETLALGASIYPSSHLVQVDMTHESSGGLGENVRREILRYATLIERTCFVRNAEALRELIKVRFEGERRAVPVLELLDAVAGDPHVLSTSAPEETGDHPQRARVLTDLVLNSVRNQAQEVSLTNELIDILYPARPDGVISRLHTFELGFEVGAASFEAIDEGSFLVWPAAMFASGHAGASLGRFRRQLHVRYQDEERRTDQPVRVVIAELVYVPPLERYSNITIRHKPHQFEIQLGVCYKQDGVERISVDDLEVRRASNDRLYLWSRRLHAQVLVAESHMFATPRYGPLIARMLRVVAGDGLGMPQPFNWGTQFKVSPFLPRLRHGRLILSRATWRFRSKNGNDREAWETELAEFASAWALPRYVSLAEGDQRLLLDFKSPSIFDLIWILKGSRQELTFEEMIQPEDHWVQLDGKPAVTEFVASFSSNQRGATESFIEPAADTRAHGVSATAPWLYFQFYLPPHRFDTLLRVYVNDLLTSISRPEHPLTWFFVRYRTNEPQLRLRISGLDIGSIEVVRKTIETWRQSGIITRWAIVPYEPETDRYGGSEGMKLAEGIFGQSSRYAMESIMRRDTSDRVRCLEQAACFLSALEISLIHVDDMTKWREITRPAGPYRKLEPWQREAPGNSWLSARAIMVADLAPLTHEFRQIPDDGSNRRFDRALSLGHMHCNRLGLSQEMEMRARAHVWSSSYSLAAREAANTERRGDQSAGFSAIGSVSSVQTGRASLHPTSSARRITGN
jgi:thiopeptide-type bacteriocin biosynthesis protein